MKKKIIIVLIFCFICITSATAEISNDLKYTIKKSTVSLFMSGESGSGFCTGIVIENSPLESKVLTAKHCVNEYMDIYVGKNVAKYSVVASRDDLAYVVFDSYISGKDAVRFADNSVDIGDLIYHFGYPTSGDYWSEGKVDRITKESVYGSFNVIPGCSGGGVFNKNGELVGILYAKVAFSPYDNGISIFEPLNDVNKFLEGIK